MPRNKNVQLLVSLISALTLRLLVVPQLEGENLLIKISSIIAILVIGAFYIIRSTANIIEETTDVLAKVTRLSGGLLQSFGTAFPDMVLGVVAAFLSLNAYEANPLLAVNYAIIAAATTFGSNIYNMAYASWCISRQNKANIQNKNIYMMPKLEIFGKVKPFKMHKTKPTSIEIDTCIEVTSYLSILTMLVALSMVMFGSIDGSKYGFSGDLYQLKQHLGVVLFLITFFILYYFRQNKHITTVAPDEIEMDEKFYNKNRIGVVWLHLFVSAVAILVTAESMVHAIQVLCTISHLPFFTAGVMAGLIGCLGEILVIHNFSINPNGRIGDAVTGVAMDNIVTIMGASIVAMIGGIFLGGKDMIIIFVLILTLNSILMNQVAKLKNYI